MKKLIVLSLLSLLAACQQKAASHLVVFIENEDGIEPYQTRVISSPNFLRFDDGKGSNDYVLYDRKAEKIYNVTAETKTIMVVERKQHDLKPPMELKHTVNDIGLMKDAPSIKGIQPRHFQYLTNGKVCVDVISVEGLMEDALAGMREFHMVLASDSALTFAALPADLHEPCEISFSTFAPVRHLQKGFPVQEWKPGYSRSLVDFKENYQADPKLFKLPEGYFVYKIQDYREGRVDFENRKTMTNAPGKEPQQSVEKKTSS